MTPQRAKRIVVAFRLAGEPGRRKLGGFLRYIAEHELDWGLQFVRHLVSLSRTRLRALRVRASRSGNPTPSARANLAIAFGDLPSAAFRRISLRPPKSIRWSPVGFMMSEHWPRGTLVTRLCERGSLALSLIRSSNETRAHRPRTTLRFVYVGLRPRSGSARTTLAPPSERPDGRWISAFLTVRRFLYSNDSFHSFSPAEFCSAYLFPPEFVIAAPPLSKFS